jgi:hypothetical protein
LLFFWFSPVLVTVLISSDDEDEDAILSDSMDSLSLGGLSSLSSRISSKPKTSMLKKATKKATKNTNKRVRELAVEHKAAQSPR